MRSRQTGGAPAILFLFLLLALLVAAGFAALRVGPPPEVTIDPGLRGIGRRTPITGKVREPKRGVGKVTIDLVQGTAARVLAEKVLEPSPSWSLWTAGTPETEIRVEVGRETVPGLTAGSATIRVTVERAGSWLRHPDPIVHELTLPVRLTAPSVHVLSSATYVNQGGAEAVVYRVGETATSDGVRCGEWLFPGYPLPGGGPQDRFALFGAPYDVADPSKIKLVAVDDAGNEAQVAFIDKFFPQPLRHDTIELTDAFLAKVVPEILGQTSELEDRGSPLDNYLAINGELRKKNNATLVELARASKPAFLWGHSFQPMPSTKVMSAFADRRRYVYGGKVVDHQDHLGFDLASTRGAPVPAANDGIVVLARYFGIYGNCVVIDHGYGLATLYGHLSSTDVKEGQEVRRGEALGRSGQSGLAGGDHLHFSVLLQGLSVNPKEWWDEHWIQDRIARKLGPAFPFSGA